MQKITKPHIPEVKKYIITAGINFFETGKKSVYGGTTPVTTKLIKKYVCGKWLNLACGDGRYNSTLLEKADFVVASDIDKSALSKLLLNTNKKYLPKLEIKAFNITKRFPFKNNSFDGVFCTGTLHFFPKKILNNILSEINRILKSNRSIIIDFPTNVKRFLSNGDAIIFYHEPLYTPKEAKKILTLFLKNYNIEMHEWTLSKYPQKINPAYRFSGKLIIVGANKKIRFPFNNYDKTLNLMDSFLQESRKSQKRLIIIEKAKFIVKKGVFSPINYSDSKIFAKFLKKYLRKNHQFLEIGCGVGVISIIAALKGLSVVAIDINPKAVENTKINANLNEVKLQVRLGDVYSSLRRNEKFDYIFWNVPYGLINKNKKISLFQKSIFNPGYQSIITYISKAHKYLKKNGKLFIGFSETLGKLNLLKKIVQKYHYRLIKLDNTFDEYNISYELYEIKRNDN